MARRIVSSIKPKGSERLLEVMVQPPLLPGQPWRVSSRWRAESGRRKFVHGYGKDHVDAWDDMADKCLKLGLGDAE